MIICKLIHELIALFKDRYTSAMECLEEDLAECLTYLRFPQAHWKVIRTSNLLERTFGEGRRRTKVIPRFPTESAGLRLLYATLITASRSWKGVRRHPDTWFEIELLRREAFAVPSQRAYCVKIKCYRSSYGCVINHVTKALRVLALPC